MTVKELFAELSKYPLDMKVYLDNYGAFDGAKGCSKMTLEQGEYSAWEKNDTNFRRGRPLGQAFEAVVIGRER